MYSVFLPVVSEIIGHSGKEKQQKTTFFLFIGIRFITYYIRVRSM